LESLITAQSHIISDSGSCFTSKEFDDFMLEFDIKHMKIATGSS